MGNLEPKSDDTIEKYNNLRSRLIRILGIAETASDEGIGTIVQSLRNQVAGHHIDTQRGEKHYG